MKTMVKRSVDQKLRLRNFDARNERIETGAVVMYRRGQRGVERGPGDHNQLKAKRTVREETNAVSGTTVKISVQNRHQKPLHPLNHEHQEVEVRRGKRTSEARVYLGRSIDSCAATS